MAEVTTEDLSSVWGCHKFRLRKDSTTATSAYQLMVRGIVDGEEEAKADDGMWIALLQPLTSGNGLLDPLMARRYRGNANGPLFAICSSYDGTEWVWRGVYEW